MVKRRDGGVSPLLLGVLVAVAVLAGAGYLGYLDEPVDLVVGLFVSEPVEPPQRAVKLTRPTAPARPSWVVRALPRAEIAAVGETDPFGYPLATADKLELLGWLRERRFDELDEALRFYQSAFEADVHRERWVTDAFAAFAVGDPTLEPLLDEWVVGHPDAYPAALARAVFHRNRISESRAAGWLRGQDAGAAADVRRSLQRSLADATLALELEPKLVVAVELLLGAAIAGDSDGSPEELLAQGLAISPNAFEIRAAYVQRVAKPPLADPAEAAKVPTLAAFAQSAGKGSAHNAKLALARGWSDWVEARDAASRGEHEVALELYGRALHAGESAEVLRDRAYTLYEIERFKPALADLERAAALRPQDPVSLGRRALVAAAAGEIDRSIGDLESAEQLDPGCACLVGVRDRIAAHLIAQGRRAHEAGRNAEALRALDAGIYVAPSALAYLTRGSLRAGMDQRSGSLADVELAVRLKPEELAIYEDGQKTLATLGAWEQSIAIWDRYLARQPREPRAWLLRSRAWEQLGDAERAAADAAKACELGSSEACSTSG
jgi:tetratricopeptide (TPR) repeat protein